MNHLKYVAAFAMAAISLPAGAATLYSGSSASPLATTDAFSFIAASSSTAGALSFTIDGFITLDGVNAYEDDFTLSLNGTAILQLSYDLGGGGSNAIFTNLVGATVSDPYSVSGHKAIDITIASLSLLPGDNEFVFSYASPEGDALGGAGPHAGFQGLVDEAWGVTNVSLTNQVIGSALPEPTSWALMLGGFGLIGGAMRRRQPALRIA